MSKVHLSPFGSTLCALEAKHDVVFFVLPYEGVSAQGWSILALFVATDAWQDRMGSALQSSGLCVMPMWLLVLFTTEMWDGRSHAWKLHIRRLRNGNLRVHAMQVHWFCKGVWNCYTAIASTRLDTCQVNRLNRFNSFSQVTICNHKMTRMTVFEHLSDDLCMGHFDGRCCVLLPCGWFAAGYPAVTKHWRLHAPWWFPPTQQNFVKSLLLWSEITLCLQTVCMCTCLFWMWPSLPEVKNARSLDNNRGHDYS